MARTQYYGIKFPTQVVWNRALFDLNLTAADMVKSQIVHLIFTPQGQKLRDPLFGTNLIKYIFDPSDDLTWDSVVMEIKDKVKKYVPKCEIIDVEIIPEDEERGLAVNVKYSVMEEDGVSRTYELEQTL